MKSQSEINFSENAINFLLFSYFEMVSDDIKEENQKGVILICAKRAYRDLNRTLRFSTKSDKIRENFRKDLCEKIKDEILKLLNELEETNELFNKKTFDERHDQICQSIMKTCQSFKNEQNDTILLSTKNSKKNTDINPNKQAQNFHYGQAQKWLNMTLKYMWLLGLWEKEFEKILPVLHVPVDSFIIEKVWNNSAIYLPCDDRKRNQKYSEEKVDSWSRWDCEAYKEFQNSLRNFLGGKNPIEWECSTWLEIAKKPKKLNN